MEVDPDIEATGLLSGLEGSERAERAELVSWLIANGITVEQIRGSISPMLLPARRLIGDDGSFVSAHEVAAKIGLDLTTMRRILRAVGLPDVDDPDAAVYLTADAEVAGHTAKFLALGIDPDALLQATRTLSEGLANAAEMIRYAVLASVLRPGATEVEIATDSQRMAAATAPLIGPMIEDMLLLQLRHSMETEAVSASERASGQSLPGARQIAVAFADLVDFTRLGEALDPEKLEALAHRLGEMAREVAVPPVRFVKTIGDAVMLVCAEPVPLLEAMLALACAAEADRPSPVCGSAWPSATRSVAPAIGSVVR